MTEETKHAGTERWTNDDVVNTVEENHTIKEDGTAVSDIYCIIHTGTRHSLRKKREEKQKSDDPGRTTTRPLPSTSERMKALGNTGEEEGGKFTRTCILGYTEICRLQIGQNKTEPGCRRSL